LLHDLSYVFVEMRVGAFAYFNYICPFVENKVLRFRATLPRNENWSICPRNPEVTVERS
jgi:hypothetical protein